MSNKINPESMWYIDYNCNVCGQQGTVRLSGKDMIVDDEGDITINPKKPIYCCECKSEDMAFEDIECYTGDQEMEDE